MGCYGTFCRFFFITTTHLKQLLQPTSKTLRHYHLPTSPYPLILTYSTIMPLARRHAPRTARATRTTARPSLKTRLMGGRKTRTKRTPGTTVTTTTTTRTTRTTGGHHGHATPVHHHKRHATMGDKVSGMMMKLKGSLTHRPGLKVGRNHSLYPMHR